ncbi:FAD:protein FMN transferase [Nannocystaceae bacterium ST9]
MRGSLAAIVLGLALACSSEPRERVDERSPAPEPPLRADEPPPPTEPEEPPPIRPDGTIFAETELMGTHVSINLWLAPDEDAVEAGKAIRDAMAEISRIEDIASEWQPQSELSALNRAAGGEPMILSPELFEILERAKQVSADTKGLFDVTFHGVGALWSFTPGSQPPPAEAIAERLALIDWQQLELEPATRSARLAKPGMKVGLGAIAKGYAVDKAAALLSARGFHHHIVEAGGDTYVTGGKGDKAWRVGVQDPERADGRIGHLIVRDQSVVTSGNYARFFEWEGVHYTHILDPRTGWPVPADRTPKSVTLIARDATTADAYCTAVSVMEPSVGLAFVEARPELQTIIIGPSGEVLISSGLAEMFVDERPKP